MVKARLALNNKICLIFDSIQTNSWINEGKVTAEGITNVLKFFKEEGIGMDNISAICLTDVYGKPTASAFKDKAAYVKEVLESQAFNVLVTVGAESFNRIVGFKGIQKYTGRALYSEIYPNQKCIPLNNPAMIKYDPSIEQVIKSSIKFIKHEMEFADIREVDKLPTDYVDINTISKFKQFINYFKSDKVIEMSFDLETSGFAFNSDFILCSQFSHKIGKSYVIPSDFYNIWTDEEWAYIKVELKELLEDTRKVVIGHNIKFDLRFVYHHWGVAIRRPEHMEDTMLMAYLCDENSPNDLKYLACNFTDMGDYEFFLDKYKIDYCKQNKIKQKEFSYKYVPYDILFQYSACDTDATLRLYYHFKELLKVEEQEDVYVRLKRTMWLFTWQEIWGWPVDLDYAKKYSQELADKIEKLNAELLECPEIKSASVVLSKRTLDKENEKRKTPIAELKVPFVFNFSSNPQKHCLFFEIMKLPVVKYTKSKGKKTDVKNPSTDKEVIAEWTRLHEDKEEFLLKILKLGEYRKMKSTYVDSIIERSVAGRIHPTYNPIGTKTGRPSSSSPNFNNLPVKNDEAKNVKKIIKAPEGRIIEGADLQAAEMRGAAIYSNDPVLITAFLNHEDIHGVVAKELFPYITCPSKEVKAAYPFERNEISKRVQFLSLYLGTYIALVGNVNVAIKKINKDRKNKNEELRLKGEPELPYLDLMTDDEGKKILSDYFTRLSGVDKYIKDTISFVEINGYSLSLLGRKRRVPGVFSDDERVRAEAIRQAVNSTIQSFSSDGLLESSCDMLEEILDKKLDIKLLGNIYDAQYQELDESLRDFGRDFMIKHMSKFPVPNAPIEMECEVSWGNSWADFSEDFGESLAQLEVEDEELEEDELEEAA